MVRTDPRYYQIAIQERENYGELPRSDNPMDLLFLKHLHPLTTIMPDHSHITELLDNTHRKTQDLTFLINQAHALSVRMKLATNWTTRLYQKGAGPVNFNTEQASRVEHLLGYIESRDNSNSMRFHAAVTCRFWLRWDREPSRTDCRLPLYHAHRYQTSALTLASHAAAGTNPPSEHNPHSRQLGRARTNGLGAARTSQVSRMFS